MRRSDPRRYMLALAGAVILAGCVRSTPITTAPAHPDVAPARPGPGAGALTISAKTPPMHNAVLSIDLPTVARVASASNLDILRAREEVRAGRGRLAGAVGQLYPTLSPTALFEVVNGKVRATRGNIVDVGFNTLRTFLSVDWILNPGRVFYEIVAAKRRLAAAEHQQRAVNIQTIHDAVIQFYDLALAQSRVESAEQALVESRELWRINTLRARAGTGLPADLLRSKAKLAQRQQDRVIELNHFYQASVALALTLRLDATLTLIPHVESLPPITLVREDLSIEELLDIALAYRPDLARIRALVKASRADRGAALWGGVGPTFNGGVLIGGISGHNVDGVRALDHDPGFNRDQRGSVGARFHLSASTIGDLRVAGAVEAQTQLEALRIMDQIKAQVVTSLQSSRSSAELIDAARRRVDYARSALKLIETNLRVGMMTTLDVLQAEDALASARLGYAQAIVGYNQSQVDLLSSLGLLDDSSLFPFGHDEQAESAPVEPARSKAGEKPSNGR